MILIYPMAGCMLVVQLMGGVSNSTFLLGTIMANGWEDLKKGDIALIIDINSSDDYYRQRLLALGVLPGMVFKIIRVAPLGDPIEILLEDRISVSLRKKEIGSIKVRTIH